MSQTGGPGGGALLRSQETGWAGLGDGGMATPSCSGIRSATQALSNHPLISLLEIICAHQSLGRLWVGWSVSRALPRAGSDLLAELTYLVNA